MIRRWVVASVLAIAPAIAVAQSGAPTSSPSAPATPPASAPATATSSVPASSTGSAAPAADSTRPATGSATLPTGSPTPPTGSATPPTGSAASTGSATAPPSAAGSGAAAGSAPPTAGSATPPSAAGTLPTTKPFRPQVPTAPAHAGSAAPPAHDAHAEGKHGTAADTLFAIKVIAGLVTLMVLAYLGGHRRVVRFQERLGISGVITAGFPFVALGAFASLPSINILNESVLAQLRPVLHFGLGWLGFIIGAQLDIRVLDRVPKGTAYLVLVEALGPFGITAAGCGLVMLAFGMSVTDGAFWRDVILLGTAAAMTAPKKFRGFSNRTWHEGRGVDVLLGQLDDLVSIVGLLFITAYFRTTESGTWQIPDTAWIFVSLGLGVAIGVLIFAMIRVPASDPEFLAIVLGGIAFAAGLAGYLHLSPIVICFIAGVLVTNFPNEQRTSVFRILQHLERPVQLIFLIIVGAVWSVGDWRGWALVPLFVAGRAIGKWTGILASRTAVGSLLPAGFAERRELVTPMSGLSIALVISIDSLYKDAGLPWIITAVIGGSIATEFLIQKINASDAPQEIDDGEGSVPIDELDDHGSDAIDGPIYRDEPGGPA